MPVNPQSYRANYSGLSAFDIDPEGRLGNLVNKPYEAYVKAKEAKNIQDYRLAQQAQAKQAMDLKNAQQAGDIKTLNDIARAKYGNQPTELDKNFTQSYLDAQKRGASEDELSFLRDDYMRNEPRTTEAYMNSFKAPHDKTNVGTSTLKDYLTQKQIEVANKQSDRTYNLNKSKAQQEVIETNPYVVTSDGKQKLVRDQKTIDKDGNIVTKTVDAYVKPVKDSKDKALTLAEQVNEIAKFLEIPLEDVANNPELMKQAKFAVDSKMKKSVYPTMSQANKSVAPMKRGAEMKIGDITYSNRPVKQKDGTYKYELTPVDKGEMVSTLPDYVKYLKDKGQDDYARILEEGDYNLGIDKMRAQQLFNLVHNLTGGNKALMDKTFSGLRTAGVRSGGLGSFLATALPNLIDFNDLPSEYSNMGEEEQKRARNAVLANLLMNGRLKILNNIGEGGVNQDGTYRYVVLDENKVPVEKEKMAEYLRTVNNKTNNRNWFEQQVHGGDTSVKNIPPNAMESFRKYRNYLRKTGAKNQNQKLADYLKQHPRRR